jgi:hypothetical protein
MHAGSVLVSGPGIEGARRLVAGASLVATSRPTRSDSAPDASAVEGPLLTAGSRDAAITSPVETQRARASHPRTSPSVDWTTLAREGAFDEAVTAAERYGTAVIAREAPEDELLLLADAARYARRPALARSLYLSTRARFASRPSAARAAFALGRLAVEQGAPWQESAQWFERVTTEQPAGPLAREAMGRQIEALQRGGANERAASVARAYLSRFPDGPSAGLARSLLR